MRVFLVYPIPPQPAFHMHGIVRPFEECLLRIKVKDCANLVDAGSVARRYISFGSSEAVLDRVGLQIFGHLVEIPNYATRSGSEEAKRAVIHISERLESAMRRMLTD